MSRGPGRIERAIASVFDAERDNAFTTEELCKRVYRRVSRVKKKHRVAVLRAARRLMVRRDTLWEYGLETSVRERRNLGSTAVFFDCTSVTSYALARLKAEGLNHYRDKSPRVGRNRIADERSLRACLARPRYAQLVAPGGAWWKHVQSWTAEIEATRAGAAKQVKERLRKR